jgi:hypothetical protein
MNMINEIAEDKQVVDKHEKIRESKIEEKNLLKFIEIDLILYNFICLLKF